MWVVSWLVVKLSGCKNHANWLFVLSQFTLWNDFCCYCVDYGSLFVMVYRVCILRAHDAVSLFAYYYKVMIVFCYFDH